MARLAFITARFPYPLEKGDKLRAYFQIKELSRDHEVHLFSLSDTEPSAEDRAAVEAYCHSIHNYIMPLRARIRSVISGLFTRIPLQCHYFYNEKIHRDMQRALAEIAPDRIHWHTLRVDRYHYDDHAHRSIDYMDALSETYRSVGRTKPWYMRWAYQMESQRLEQYERKIAGYYMQRWAISPRDVEAIRSALPIDILPNGIHTDFFRPIDEEPIYDFGFVGNLGYPPNAYAIDQLIALARACPDWKGVLYGARAESVNSASLPANLHLYGWIDDVREAYASLRCLYAPIHTGAGQQNKILEGLAMGIPVVTSHWVNDSIAAPAGTAILLADDLQSAEHQIRGLLADPDRAARVGQEGRKFVIQAYPWSRTREIFNQAFHGSDTRTA